MGEAAESALMGAIENERAYILDAARDYVRVMNESPHDLLTRGIVFVKMERAFERLDALVARSAR
jgi:hypothetical protein